MDESIKMKQEEIELHGKKVTLENISLEDVEQLFDFDKTALLLHRLELGQEYIDTHFPENTRLYNSLQKSIKRNIKLTDPKTFKNVKSPVTVNQLLSVDYISKEGIPILKKKSKSENKKSAARFLKKPRLKTKSEMVQEKLSKFQDDLKKFGIDA